MTDDWFATAKSVALDLAERNGRVCACDLTDAIGSPDDQHAANGRNNTEGTVFTQLAREGHLTRIGDHQSRQPHRRGGRHAVWRGTQGRLFDA